MSHSKWREQEREENRRLGHLLRQALQKAHGNLPPKVAEEFRILDVACGECREADTLVQVARSLVQPRKEAALAVKFVGTDIRDREVEQAAQRFASGGGTEFEFLVEDASQLSRNRELGESFDLAFLRHQNYWHQPLLWKKIFAQALEKLSQDGLLVITSYFDKEHALALSAMKEIGAELITTQRNEASIELACPGKSVDRHIAVFRRA